MSPSVHSGPLPPPTVHRPPALDDPIQLAVLGFYAAMDELLHLAVRWLSLPVLPVLHILPALDDPLHWAVLGWDALDVLIHLAVRWLSFQVLPVLLALGNTLHWAVLGWDAALPQRFQIQYFPISAIFLPPDLKSAQLFLV